MLFSRLDTLKLSIILYFTFAVKFSFAQKDSTVKYIVGGVCNTIDFYNNHTTNDMFLGQRAGSAFYQGPHASVFFGTIASPHLMLKTGLEYNFLRYYFSTLAVNVTSRYSAAYYYNVTVSLNSVTIPLYFDVLCLKQKLFIGLGPSISILPYSFYTLYDSGTTLKKSGSNPSFMGVFDAGAGFDVGYFIPLKKRQLVIEAKFNYGFTNLIIESGNYLHNNYFTAGIGYVFK